MPVWCSVLEDIPYIIDLDLVVSAARKREARRIVLQMPDGLKPYSLTIAKCLEERLPGTEVYIHSDSTFGACDLQFGQLETTIKPDLLVHVGHSPYPAELAHPGLEPPRTAVVYVPALSKAPVTREMVSEAAELLRGYGAKRVAIAATAQHVHLVRSLARMLEDAGLHVEKPRGLQPFLSDSQVLGCDYRIPRSQRADAYVYLGSGIFHPLGLYLATMKPVVRVDPYRGVTDDLTGEGEKLYKSRLFKVSQAIGAKRWGLIVGLKTGQYRPWLVSKLREAVESAGGEYQLIASEVTTSQQLAALDSEWYEAFVVTSCPRLPTDDLWVYHKPVLTPGEAFMALEGRLEPYRFPW